MANSLYTLGRQAFAAAGINWTSDTIKVALVSAAYTPILATHQYLSDLGANVIGTAQTLTSPTNSGGVLNGAGVTFSSVASGTVTYVVIYKDTGTPTTSPLIGLIDSATGLPVVANGGNINISWDVTNKIAKL